MSRGQDDSERATRLGRNEALYREVNERVKQINEAFNSLVPLGDWICECGNERCATRVAMTRDEYEAVRAVDTHFAVAPGDAHFFPDIERIVARQERYWVVEKLGVAATVAAEEAES